MQIIAFLRTGVQLNARASRSVEKRVEKHRLR
jgi:hypothetical protein